MHVFRLSNILETFAKVQVKGFRHKWWLRAFTTKVSHPVIAKETVSNHMVEEIDVSSGTFSLEVLEPGTVGLSLEGIGKFTKHLAMVIIHTHTVIVTQF